MTKEQIIQWAREAGFMLVTKSDPETGCWYECFDDELEAFAKKVRDDYSNKHAQLWLKRIDEAVKAEREACAKVCDEARTYISKNNAVIQSSAQDCAAAIRARSKE
jgi:hypothetical protein